MIRNNYQRGSGRYFVIWRKRKRMRSEQNIQVGNNGDNSDTRKGSKLICILSIALSFPSGGLMQHMGIAHVQLKTAIFIIKLSLEQIRAFYLLARNRINKLRDGIERIQKELKEIQTIREENRENQIKREDLLHIGGKRKRQRGKTDNIGKTRRGKQ